MFGADLKGVPEALERSLGREVLAPGLGTLAGFATQLQGGADEVLEQVPNSVGIVDERDQFGIVQELVAWELADLGPVLLFDMDLVLLAVGAAAGSGKPAAAD